MRAELQKRVGRRGRFTAQFSRFGLKRSQWGVKQTALMIDVRDEAGDQVTDHLWFKVGKLLRELKLVAGDRVEFYATVAPYTKLDREALEFEDEFRRTTDYCLKRPAGLRKIKTTVDSPLPLFEGSNHAEGQPEVN